jgi:beta-galactosidase GanA
MAWKPKIIDPPPYPETYPYHVSEIFGNFKQLEKVLLIDQELLAKYRQNLPALFRYDIDPTIQEIESKQEVYKKELEKILELIPVITKIHFNLLAWQKEKTNHEL